ncbi:unnamed protein product [Adineta steineri]|uniref:Uncharacterized protein n=1 Tax=Adineta steineri TaxID=433720 RepID=A0A814U0J3_9BILA|nr:unnamed protein product [Adineta steineri]CAF1494214.1 unnamed protein product [Adineta steineri]
MVISSPQINLHLTSWINANKSDVVFQRDCLYVTPSTEAETDTYQIISYCLTNTSSEWNIKEDTLGQKFSFAELHKQNITSQQLYIWSAPMDVVERYQLYLNKLSTSAEQTFTELTVFYNCTIPRFGPLCQYSLMNYDSDDSSINEVVYRFYQDPYEPSDLTCYTHLECNRGSTLVCLDWSEICNGQIDCLNDGIDEENCWQLEINDCEENEYRCDNGQCVTKIFLRDDELTFECLDRSDEGRDSLGINQDIIGEPTFSQEEVICLIDSSMSSTKITSSCVLQRYSLLDEKLHVDTPHSLNFTCWLAFKCHYGVSISADSGCDESISSEIYKQIINESCPDILFIPAGTLIFGHIYLAYIKKSIVDTGAFRPDYICYNEQLCSGFYSNVTVLKFNNSTCRRPKDFPVVYIPPSGGWMQWHVKTLYRYLYQCNTIIYKDASICKHPTMYQCINSSKCISIYRVCDGLIDCDNKDDEHCPSINGTCPALGTHKFFRCITKNTCISSKRLGDGLCQCGDDKHGLCEDEISDAYYIRTRMSFPTTCDGFTELIPVVFDGRNETDETECENWQCNNIYTRCNGVWNCLNGADELGCDSSQSLACPLHQHVCISSMTNQLICLPIEYANDGNIDCVGATDEPKLCRPNYHVTRMYQKFYCKNNAVHSCISSITLCSKNKQCSPKDDEQFCCQNQTISRPLAICDCRNESIYTDVKRFVCKHYADEMRQSFLYFSIDASKPSVKQLTVEDQTARSHPASITHEYDKRCHRGFPLLVWLDNDTIANTTACLCPPSYSGDRCQYQNQRVSLTLKFQTFSHSRRTLFALIVSLIDDSDERIIHSYEQLIYLYIQHCQTKFNIYLLYSSRPKLSTANYSIHIDIYEKISFIYRGSLFVPLNYPFLPVHRVAVQLTIPRISDSKEICSDQKCIHGRCVKYSNNAKEPGFCLCDRDWSGKYCTIPYTCTCSSDSLCIGRSANNRSICICPLNKRGSLCLLSSKICHSDQNTTCNNNGQCVSVNENIATNKSFICMCSKGFSGERCEEIDSKIIISFHKDIILPPLVLVHFIRVFPDAPPENGSTFKIIPVNQNSVTVRWSHPFHISFVELFNNNYYLIAVQNIYNRSFDISKTLHPSDRCKHISEVLSETIVKFHRLRRIKYYHVPCRNYTPSLSCFYDDNYFCLCNDYDHQRVANCFEFNPSIEHDCFGQSNCENGARCLQDNAICPQTSICVCPACFHGTQCQFSSSSFGVSLDAILGYHIQPHITMKFQPSIVKFSIALTTILLVVGLINGILSIITFMNKETRKVGCGFYLLGTSITTLLIVIIFTLKFSILIIAQITYITNQSFLKFQCYSIDFLLRTCLIIDQWLNACVAIERAYTLIKRTSFDKKKSIQRAKFIIVAIILLAIGTTIHDPIHRHLLYEDSNNNDDDDDDNGQRIWCIVTYSTSLQTYNMVMNIFHFFAPFIINIISSITIIIMATRQRTTVQTNEPYRKLLYEQLREHSHLLIGPIILVILALPRLIISVISTCMNSVSDSWLFLIGYFISLLPPMLTFVVFVLPYRLYKKEFYETVRRYRKSIQSRLRPAL